ncbi:hypothetical protein FJ959_04090 [Mesorhizobium sp. B2-2-4]|nr:hypothetical protein FJ959_04090 [Mesorhizobium sp. B2-2-4]TPM69559.1 hypothetical protein FJ965_05490 [Mesorhizobium sp. B2-2-1]TPN17010.1 hypothetical protein FJ973_01140 [Mesorhizobium sp. B2-1-3]TPN72668.1 hypothetical protein FJ984_00320 [Mesorhizobium sp. B1-1-3]
MRPFLILSLCNRSFAGPALARSKPRRDEWPERERAYRKKGFGSQSGAGRCRAGVAGPGMRTFGGNYISPTKGEIGKKAAIA